jgi:hypothetical protein
VRSTTFLFITWYTFVAKFWVNLSRTLPVRHRKADRDGTRAPTRPRACARCSAPRRLGPLAPARGRSFPRPGALRDPWSPCRATWSPRPHQPAARRETHQSVTVLPYAGAAANVARRTAEFRVGELLPRGRCHPPAIPGLYNGWRDPRASTREPASWAAAPPLALPRWARLPYAPQAGQTSLALPHTLVHSSGSATAVPCRQARRSGSRRCRSRRGRSRPAPAGRARPSRPASFAGHKANLGEPHTLSLHFPSQGCRRSRQIPANRAAPHPRGLHCKQPALSRVIFGNQGRICEVLEIPRTPVQNLISNSICVLLILVNSVENFRKVRKIQNKFSWIPGEK